MKKAIALLLVLVMLATLFGCTNATEQTDVETNSSSGEVTEKKTEEREKFTMWFWGAATNYQEHMKSVLCDWYNNSQDKYELVVEFRNSAATDIPVALAAGEGPDIVCPDGAQGITMYANEGFIMDLSKYAEQYNWKDRTLSVLYDICTVDEALYAVPGGLLSGGLFYNKKIFEENGWSVPSTLDEMIDVMEAAKEVGLYPLSAGNKGWKACNLHFASMIMDAYLEPSVFYDVLSGDIDFTDERIVEAVNKTKEWYQAGYLAGNDYINLDSSEVMLTLCQDKAAMITSY